MIKNRNYLSWIKVGTAAASVILAAVLMVNVVAADDTVMQPLAGGSRTASVADLTLGSLNYSHASQTSVGQLTLTADDSSATGEGWNVTVQAGDLGYSGAYSGSPITASELSITSANAPSSTAGQAIDGTNGPKVPASNATGSLDVARKVLHANAGYGQGTYVQTLDVELLVPGMSRAGDYTGALTVTISTGP